MMLTTTAHFHAGHNTPGFDPEPFTDRAFLDVDSARAFLTTELLEYVQVNTDGHDCAGLTCSDPDCDYSDLVYPASVAIATLWTSEYPEWAHLLHGDVWWTTPCRNGDCPDMPEEVWFRAFLDGVNPDDFDF